MVCRHLAEWDVRRFCLINRDCAAVGLEYLIPDIELHLHRHNYKAHSFERLQQIAAHPVVRKSVRVLYYDSLTFDTSMKDFASWKAATEETLTLALAARGNGQRFGIQQTRTRSDYQRLYNWYQFCIHEQEYWVKSEDGIKMSLRPPAKSYEPREDPDDHE
jgi:hypothetical protein